MLDIWCIKNITQMLQLQYFLYFFCVFFEILCNSSKFNPLFLYIINIHFIAQFKCVFPYFSIIWLFTTFFLYFLLSIVIFFIHISLSCFFFRKFVCVICYFLLLFPFFSAIFSFLILKNCCCFLFSLLFFWNFKCFSNHPVLLLLFPPASVFFPAVSCILFTRSIYWL